MKKGISFYFGYEIPVRERAQIIKKYGFDCVIDNADPSLYSQNGKFKYRMKVLKEVGLELSSLHCRYRKNELPNFWLPGKRGDKITKNYIKDIKIAKKYGFLCVVAHFVGEYSLIGEKRLKRILKVCEKTNIPLAVENLSDKTIMDQIFLNNKSDYLKMCYDSGHNNAFNPDVNYFDEYGSKIITLHLHNNDGTSDQHTLKGNVNWDMIAENLKDNIILDYEILPRVLKPKTAEECLKKVKTMADSLEKKILEYNHKKK